MKINCTALLINTILSIIFVSDYSSASDYYTHGVRPKFEGTQEEYHKQTVENKDIGFCEVINDDFQHMKNILGSKYPLIKDIKLNFNSNTYFDASTNCKEIAISKELRLLMYRIAEANVMIALLPDARLNKQEALGLYINELAKIYTDQIIRHDRAALNGRPPEISEFLGLPDNETLQITNKANFIPESVFQWQSLMRSVLSHEMAHIILHCTSSSRNIPTIEREIEADKEAMNIISLTWPGEIASSSLLQSFFMAYFYYRPDIGVTTTRELCHRNVNELLSSIPGMRRALMENPDVDLIVKHRYGLDLLTSSDSDLNIFIRNLHDNCSKIK
ncbi:hypothetical protein [Desulfolutivibrio sp.]|uniref:hypothetical protein n=1 Tax=Desulfolutivibrio sp. TaxID=2773296 RepID=UPI002F96448C